MIGPRWANAHNLRRLRAENDIVRHELVKALASDAITMVPTLVEDLKVKDVPAGKLPVELRPLFDVWNAHEITEDGWEDDTRRLIDEIAAASGLPVKSGLAMLMHDVGAVEQRVQELGRVSNLQTRRIGALRRAVDDLRGKLAEASEADRPRLAEAFAALAHGDSGPAEAVFQQECNAHGYSEDAGQKRLDTALKIRDLALLRDVNKATEDYDKAPAADSENVERAHPQQSLRQKGDVWGETECELGNVSVRRGLSEGTHGLRGRVASTRGRPVIDPSKTE